jgi:hypothetical protein
VHHVGFTILIYYDVGQQNSILILSSHLCLGLPSGLFPSGFPTKPYTRLSPPPIRATCPTHLTNCSIPINASFPSTLRNVMFAVLQFHSCGTVGNKRRPEVMYLVRYSDSLHARWSGDRIPVGVRFSKFIQTGLGTHAAFQVNRYRVITRAKTAGAWS